MSDLLHEIAQRLQNDFQFKPTPNSQFLRKGHCPACSNKSLWAYLEQAAQIPDITPALACLTLGGICTPVEMRVHGVGAVCFPPGVFQC
ncbi:hypothetical protein [Comamonas aquatica]|uniref:hypothetical protein n=1 Tax=Comamonas aquatica TaxID=225991 RepID=UPI0031E2B94C